MLPHIRRMAETLEEELRALPDAVVEKTDGGWKMSIDGLVFFSYRPRVEFLALDLWLDERSREDFLMLPFVSEQADGDQSAVTVHLDSSENLRLSLEWIRAAYNIARTRTRPRSSAIS